LSSGTVDPLISALSIAAKGIRARAAFLRAVSALLLVEIRAVLVLRQLLSILCLPLGLAILRLP
jgi:hypothetical protein